VAIGDTDLTEAQFMQLAARNERLVRFRGQWIALDPALLAQIRKAMASMDNTRGLSFQDVLQLHLLAEGHAGDAADGSSTAAAEEESERVRLEVELNEQLIQLVGQLSGQRERPLPRVPNGLRADLRSYQHEGYAWLTFLRRFGLGACLADDMG